MNAHRYSRAPGRHAWEHPQSTASGARTGAVRHSMDDALRRERILHPHNATDAALNRATAQLEPGWVALRDCVIDDADPPLSVHYALLHPNIGVLLLDIGRNFAPDAAERLRRQLDAVGFQARFGGEPRIVYRVLQADQLNRLGSVIDYAFATEPALVLAGGDAWIEAMRSLLTTSQVPTRVRDAEVVAQRPVMAGVAAARHERGSAAIRGAMRYLGVPLWALCFEALTAIGSAAVLLPHFGVPSLAISAQGAVGAAGAEAQGRSQGSEARHVGVVSGAEARHVPSPTPTPDGRAGAPAPAQPDASAMRPGSRKVQAKSEVTSTSAAERDSRDAGPLRDGVMHPAESRGRTVARAVPHGRPVAAQGTSAMAAHPEVESAPDMPLGRDPRPGCHWPPHSTAGRSRESRPEPNAVRQLRAASAIIRKI